MWSGKISIMRPNLIVIRLEVGIDGVRLRRQKPAFLLVAFLYYVNIFRFGQNYIYPAYIR
jgi:hypothetical protein